MFRRKAKNTTPTKPDIISTTNTSNITLMIDGKVIYTGKLDKIIEIASVIPYVDPKYSKPLFDQHNKDEQLPVIGSKYTYLNPNTNIKSYLGVLEKVTFQNATYPEYYHGTPETNTCLLLTLKFDISSLQIKLNRMDNNKLPENLQEAFKFEKKLESDTQKTLHKELKNIYYYNPDTDTNLINYTAGYSDDKFTFVGGYLSHKTKKNKARKTKRKTKYNKNKI